MTRINIYAPDEYGDPGTELAGWFDVDKAEAWTDANYDRTGHGEGLYRTAQGKWVLDDITGRCVFIPPDAAREWLLASRKDAAIAKYFGPTPEEEDRRPGRPAVGQAINVRPGGELLSQLDAYAKEHGHSRAEAIRVLLGESLTAAQPYTVTFRDISTGVREIDSRHASLGAAVEALRKQEAWDSENNGLPSYRYRVEHDGRPVDVEAMSE